MRRNTYVVQISAKNPQCLFLSRDGIYNNDIAVIRIRRKGDGKGITFSERVSPACLPRRAFEEGKECFIAGWGKTHGS